MTPLQNLLLWNTRTAKTRDQSDAFADPLERPEWQGYGPIVTLIKRLQKERQKPL